MRIENTTQAYGVVSLQKCLDRTYCVWWLFACLAISSYLDAAWLLHTTLSCPCSLAPLLFIFPSVYWGWTFGALLWLLACVDSYVEWRFFSKFGLPFWLARLFLFHSPPPFSWVLLSVALALLYAARWLRHLLILIFFPYSDCQGGGFLLALYFAWVCCLFVRAVCC